MLLGAMFLIRSPLTPVELVLALRWRRRCHSRFLTVFLMRLVLKSRKWKTATGKEELLGEQGVVTIALPGEERDDPCSRRIVARAFQRKYSVGARVRVLRVEGLKLDVEPLPQGHPSRSEIER